MIEVIGTLILALFFVGISLGMIVMMFEDTDTFRAIDARIARWIKGADDGD